MVEEVTTFSDADWAGCKDTRTSSSAGVVLLGSHTLNAYMRRQKIIARSSAEAELYAAALGASESKGIGSLLKNLGYEMKRVLAIDAKTIAHIFHRQGTGRLKHIDVAWMQDEVRSKRLRLRVRKTLQICGPNCKSVQFSHSAKESSMLRIAGCCSLKE